MNPAFWSGRRVLITGHTGFKGAWLTLLLRALGAEVSGLALAPAPGAAFDRLSLRTAMASHECDIRDREAVREVLEQHRPDVVLHLAAQALVRESYADPVSTFDVNVTGTAVLLDAIRSVPSVRVAVVVTSDKVYANDGSGRNFVEADPLGGGDPYSASKAAAEMVVQAWQHSFASNGPAVVAARAGNVIGGGDRAPDRLIPDLMRAIEGDVVLPVRNPEAVRPWQFVLEPLSGYLAHAEAAWNDPASVPAALNFGPPVESAWSVAAVADALVDRAGRGKWEHRPDPNGGLEATLLTLDSSAATRLLGWKPILDLETALDWTLAWFEAEWSDADPSSVAETQIARYLSLVGAS